MINKLIKHSYLFLWLFVSCNNTNLEVLNDGIVDQIVREVELQGTGSEVVETTEFYYNENNQLEQIYYSYPYFELQWTLNMEYKIADQIEIDYRNIDCDVCGSLTIYYNENRIDSVIRYESGYNSNNQSIFSFFNYDNDTIWQLDSTNFNIRDPEEYQYSRIDSSSWLVNGKGQLSYHNWRTYQKRNYEYDDRVNPLSDSFIQLDQPYFGIFISPLKKQNNVITTYFLQEGDYQYTYHSNGVPDKRVITGGSNIKYVTRYIY